MYNKILLLFSVPAPMAPDISVNIHGSLKKRVAPPPPPAGSTGGIPSSHYGTLPSSASLAASTHSRTTSEPILAGHSLHTLPHALNTLNSQHHKRSPSGDSSTGHGAFENSRKLLYELSPSSGKFRIFRSFLFSKFIRFCLLLGSDKVNSSTLQRPRNPPPPAPSSINSSRLSNGRSSESLSSMCSDHGLGNPVPPPRKVCSYFYLIIWIFIYGNRIIFSFNEKKYKTPNQRNRGITYNFFFFYYFQLCIACSFNYFTLRRMIFYLYFIWRIIRHRYQ